MFSVTSVIKSILSSYSMPADKHNSSVMSYGHIISAKESFLANPMNNLYQRHYLHILRYGLFTVNFLQTISEPTWQKDDQTPETNCAVVFHKVFTVILASIPTIHNTLPSRQHYSIAHLMSWIVYACGNQHSVCSHTVGLCTLCHKLAQKFLT